MRLLAATGDAVARLDEDGEGFRVSLRLEGSGAQCLAAGEGVVYAGCRGSGVWRSDDEGETWRDLDLPAPRPLYNALSSERGWLMPSLDDALARYTAECEWKHSFLSAPDIALTDVLQ